MRRSGTSVPWIAEHAVKAPDDLRVLADVFENMDVVANYEAFKAHQAEVGEDGLPVTAFTVAAGPVHHIQKYFLDATEFFHYYRDHQPEILYLADALAPLYEKALRIVAESPAEVIQWGSNFDDMLTFPPMFTQHFVPWIRKAKEVLGPKNIRILCHTDGENFGLMDLLHESGMDVAEAVCPAPMTKVSIQEYYRRWSDRITIFGGVPSNLLLPQLTPDEQFKSFMDALFSGIGDGRRFVLGIADTTPPDADFERLVRIGDMVREKGRLPLQAGAFNPVDTAAVAKVLAKKEPAAPAPQDTRFAKIRQAVLDGREQDLIGEVQELLQWKVAPKEIIDLGMVAAMESLNQSFKNGTVFIPEVLAAARAMNAAVLFLEPHLAEKDKRGGGKILIGTVKGDLHDIGKNMVATMLRGVGFNVVDLGDQRCGRCLCQKSCRGTAAGPGIVRPAHHHHAGNAQGHRRLDPGWNPRNRKGHCRRRPGESKFRQRHRRRRVRQGRGRSHRPCPKSDRLKSSQCNVEARSCSCLFGLWPKIQAARYEGGR